MFNVGGGEMFVILLLALIVLGPERLPKAMGQVGRFVGQVRRMSSGFQEEIQRAMDPDNAPFRPGEERLPGPRPAIEDEVKVVNPGGPGEVAAAAGLDPARGDGDDDTGEDAPGAPDPAGGPEDTDGLPAAEADRGTVDGGDLGETATGPEGAAPGEGTVTPLRPRGEGDGDARATG